jgi:hypothetical protein
VGPTQVFVRRGTEEVHVSVLQSARDPVVDQVSVLKRMSLVDGGRELVRNSELEVTPRPFVASQKLEAFGKWAIGREEVVDTVDLGMEDVLEVCAFGDDAANPVARPSEGAQFYGGEVRKDEDDQFGWKVEEGRRTGLERHSAPRSKRPLYSP